MHVHEPVLTREISEIFAPVEGRVIVDCTVGSGGHAEVIAKFLSPEGKLVGIELDFSAIERAKKKLSFLKERLFLVHDNFANLKEILRRLDLHCANIILADLGVSLEQLTSPSRGFSFTSNCPLDMRMNTEQTTTAADILNTFTEEELGKIIRQYGEERYWRQIARKVVMVREKTPILTTEQLVGVICQAAGKSAAKKKHKIHPATRTFQALRIAVNNELDNLRILLESLPEVLSPLGRAAFISFHSLEDRLVKAEFKRLKSEGYFSILSPKPIIPLEDEIRRNPRARSAKMRVIMRNKDVPPIGR